MAKINTSDIKLTNFRDFVPISSSPIPSGNYAYFPLFSVRKYSAIMVCTFVGQVLEACEIFSNRIMIAHSW
jgi:hypothetical protein